MKICSRCNEEKELTAFYRAATMKDGYQPCCKTCADIQTKNSRSKKLDHYRGLQQKYKKIRQTALLELKRKETCVVCGEDEPVCLDFHHVDPTTKLFDVSDIKGYGLQKINEEINKCVVICANCHRKLHANILTISSGSKIGTALDL